MHSFEDNNVPFLDVTIYKTGTDLYYNYAYRQNRKDEK